MAGHRIPPDPSTVASVLDLTLPNIGLKFCLFHWSKILSAVAPATRDFPCKVFRDKSACQLNLLYKTLRRSVNWDIAFEFSGVSLPIISCIFTRQTDKSPNLPFQSGIVLTITFKAKRHLQHIRFFTYGYHVWQRSMMNLLESKKYILWELEFNKHDIFSITSEINWIYCHLCNISQTH